MNSSTIQAKVKPETKKAISRISKKKKMKLSSYVNKLILDDINKQNSLEKWSELKSILLDNKLTEQESNDLKEFYNLKN